MFCIHFSHGKSIPQVDGKREKILCDSEDSFLLKLETCSFSTFSSTVLICMTVGAGINVNGYMTHVLFTD